MDFLNFSKSKLCAVIAQIEKLSRGDFSHPDVSDVLKILLDRIQRHFDDIKDLTPTSGMIAKKAACRKTNLIVSQTIRLLGLVLRATNLRNPFELYEPVLQLCRLYLGHEARLIFSSEWFFSPLTFPISSVNVENYVFIGMPATESGNALVVPLVGHELGHSVWTKAGLTEHFQHGVLTEIYAAITAREDRFGDIFSTFSTDFADPGDFIEQIKTAFEWSMSQCEEIFCDLIGIQIFRESYLSAFEYLLAPQLGRRAAEYPDLQKRAEYLAAAAARWGISTPGEYPERFDRDVSAATDADQLLLETSDAATRALFDDLLSKALELSANAGVGPGDSKMIQGIVADFENVIPTRRTTWLPDVINAAWLAFHDESFWTAKPKLQVEKLRNLSELAFKSIEVIEFERLVGRAQ